jgi:hypothetical protein
MKKAEKLFKDLINENLGYVDLKPITQIEATPKLDFENKFAEYLAEETKKAKEDEAVKVDSDKIAKTVEEIESHNFDYADKSNIDNLNAEEFQKGIYFEMNKVRETVSSADLGDAIKEATKVVAKNLAKDGHYYMKNAAFGVEGLGYQDSKVEEASGKYKASGYSDKIKTVVKESLMGGVITSGHPNSIASQQGNVVKQMMEENDELEEKKQGYDDREDESLGARRGAEKDKEQSMKDRRDDSYGKFGKRDDEAEGKAKGPGKNKVKKESLDNDLAEIDRQAQIVAMEAKLDKLSEVIEAKSDRINMVTEDDNLSELMDKKKMKQMQKEVKILEKRKAKMEKIYEKSCGKKYQKVEVVDEVEEIEEKKQGYNDRLDDAEGAKHGKKKQDMAQRRADSENMEKADGKRKFSGDSKMK